MTLKEDVLTHADWFDFRAQKRFWPEVNFWTPSDERCRLEATQHSARP
jgi:hypothetical protein